MSGRRPSICPRQANRRDAISDGANDANLFEGDGLYIPSTRRQRGEMTAEIGPLYHSAGLRAFGPNKLLMVEGETKGNLDLITIDGDNAKIETIKGGFDEPVSLCRSATRSTCLTCR